MIDEKQVNKHEQTDRDRESADIVDRLRDIPMVRPRTAFRIKVALLSRFPDGAFHSRTLRMPEPEEGSWWGALLRPALAATVAMAVVLVLLVGLTVLSGSSRPGDALYALKRARESVEISFIRNPVSKANKRLATAGKRLSELESFVSAGTLDPEEIKYIAEEYNKDKEYIKQVIENDASDSETSNLQARLDSIDTKKDNLVEVMAAGSPVEMLVPAGGARVIIRDWSGRMPLENGSCKIEGRLDGNGEFEFEYLAADPNVAACVEAVIELDGRKIEAPLVQAREMTYSEGETGAVSAVLTPLPGDANRVELDNGVLRVTADGQDKGAVIKTISMARNGIDVGPFTVNLACGEVGDLPEDNMEVSGPYLVPCGSGSVAYEINYDLELDGVAVHSSYRVSLSEGDNYVSVLSNTSVKDGKAVRRSADGEPPAVLQMKLPLGTQLLVAGEPFKTQDSDGPVTVCFDEKLPFATFNSGGKSVSIIFSPDWGPAEWSLDGEYVAADFSVADLKTGTDLESTVLIGFMDEEEAALLAQTATDSDWNLTETIGARYDDDFCVTCNPALEELKPGRHDITITVRKRYEKLNDYFE